MQVNSNNTPAINEIREAAFQCGFDNCIVVEEGDKAKIVVSWGNDVFHSKFHSDIWDAMIEIDNCEILKKINKANGIA